MSQRALVLGGTGGLGAVAAAVLQSQGLSVWVTGRKPPRILVPPDLGLGDGLLTGQRPGTQSGDPPPAAPVQPLNWIPLEYRSPEQTLAAVEEALGSPLDVSYLVCNFGPFLEAPVSTMQRKDWRFLVEANLVLPGMLVSALLPEMIQRGFGRILLFGATGSDQIVGRRQTAGYQAAKTGLGVLAKSVALEAGLHNVTCNVVCPGYVETEYYSEAMKAKARRRIPGGKLDIPQDFFSLFKLLLSADTTFINGAIISSAQGL